LKKIVLYLAFTLAQLYCYGQPYYFKRYQVENGLSNNTVYCTVQDDKGFMWFGTKDGLNRFDGYAFKTYRNDANNPESIGNDQVFTLITDQHHTMLAGTKSGIYSYSPEKESFNLLKHTKGISAFSLQSDKTGNLWFISADGLYRYQRKSANITRFRIETNMEPASIYIDEQNILWVGTTHGALYRFDPASKKLQRFQILDTSLSREPGTISTILETGNGKLLIGTTTQGLMLLDPESKNTTSLISLNKDKTHIFVRDIKKTQDQEYWIATESGVYIYDDASGKITHLEKRNANRYALADNAVYTVCKDNQGGIWLGTYFGGISYYSAQYSIFSKHFPEDQENSISGSAVREIEQDKYGRLWIGTEDAGLNKYDVSTGLFTTFQPDGTKSNISYSNIHGLQLDGDKLWIGTFHHGIDIMDIRTGKVIKHYTAGKRNGLLSNFVLTFYKTKAGQLLVATTWGMYRFLPGRDYFERLSTLPLISYNSILEASDGTVWIGSFDGGLFNLSPDGKTTKHFVHQEKVSSSLSHNTISSIFEDAKKNIWITTEGGGLLKYLKAEDRFLRYTVKDGLPSNFLFRIEEDRDHTFWISSSRGLVNFNPETKYVKTYTRSDGLLTDQFNYSSSFKDANGRIYFGSLKGLISFDPEKLRNKIFNPPVFITNFHVQQNGNLNQAESYPLERSILTTRQVTLNYNQSSFNIDVAALSFFAPEMTAYAYRMTGLYDDWEYLQRNRKIYFTKLEPGTYYFQVKALVHGSKVWGKNQTMLKIIILPPIWKSRWAYLAYALLGLLTGFLLVRYFDRRLKQKNEVRRKIFEDEKQREIYEAKIEFFTMVSHEIRTPLTLIKGPMEKLIKQAQEVPAMEKNLKILHRNTERLLSLTNQLLDFRKTEINGYSLNYVRVNIPEVIREVALNFEAVAEQKNMAVQLQFCDEPFYAYVDIEAFYKIIFSLLDNAFKYGKSVVIISLAANAENQAFFHIIIKSDGPLIPAAVAEKIFEPFYRVKESKDLPGTGIGLSISRALTELHQGSLVIEQTNSTFNIFKLRLPIHHSIEFNLHEKWKKHLPSIQFNINKTSDQPS
jgi:ligand-binding sensor domain-containing protein/signal transduction histidine kinase